MKLSEYLKVCENEMEVAVTDIDYDIESYFYAGTGETDKWDMSIARLSDLLTVKKILCNGHLIVNLSEIIEKHLSELSMSDLFIYCDYGIDAIMENIESILSGNVSEDWIEKFVDILEK